MVLYRRRRLMKKKAAPKKAAVRRAAARKGAAMRRAGGRRKYGQSIPRYVTAAGLVTNSMWRTRARPLPFRVRAMKAVAAPDIDTSNYAQVLQVDPGLQRFVSYPSLNSSQLQRILNRTPSGAPNRCLIESAQTEVTFTNTTNAAAEIEIYDIVLKRQCTIEQSIITTVGAYPWIYVEDAIKAGILAGAGLSPATSPDSAIPSNWIGASAFDSQAFKDYFRVVKRSHVMLASGATHRHEQQVGVNKLLERSLVDPAVNEYIQGFTYLTLLNVRGVGAYNPSVEPAGDTTTNPLFLNVVTSLRIKYTFVADNTLTLNYTNALTFDTPNVRNIGSGAYEPAGP